MQPRDATYMIRGKMMSKLMRKPYCLLTRHILPPLNEKVNENKKNFLKSFSCYISYNFCEKLTFSHFKEKKLTKNCKNSREHKRKTKNARCEKRTRARRKKRQKGVKAEKRGAKPRKNKNALGKTERAYLIGG